MRFRIGTSGWSYPHWRGVFYPRDLRPDRWLEHYASVFDTVELNRSFYRLPSAEAFEAWRRRTPARFLFAVKASRLLTHVRRLSEPEEPLGRLLDASAALGRKRGPILFQLPPRFDKDLERLDGLLRLLPEGVRAAFEFRHPGWWDEEVFARLRDHRAALCLYDMGGEGPPLVATAPFAYVRFHGPAERHRGRYPKRQLARWADRLRALRGVRTVYCYFNNDLAGHAVRNALELRECVE